MNNDKDLNDEHLSLEDLDDLEYFDVDEDFEIELIDIEEMDYEKMDPLLAEIIKMCKSTKCKGDKKCRGFCKLVKLCSTKKC